jgi:hypothetical protein
VHDTNQGINLPAAQHHPDVWQWSYANTQQWLHRAATTAGPWYLVVDELQVDSTGPRLHLVKGKAQQVGQHTHAVCPTAKEEGEVKHTAAGTQVDTVRHAHETFLHAISNAACGLRQRLLLPF